MENNVVKLCKDYIRCGISEEFSNNVKNSDAIRAAFIEANGGSTELKYTDFLGNNKPELFSIIQEIVPVIVHEGLKGDEFFNRLVEYKNVAFGDDIVFKTKKKQYLYVADATYGTKGIRRQRLNQGESYQLKTSLKVVAVYDEVVRFMNQTTNFDEFVDAVYEAMSLKIREDVFKAFNEYTTSEALLGREYYINGSYDEEQLLTMAQHVESANEQTVRILGTKAALRKLKMDVVADQAKHDMYTMGYYGKFNGIECYEIAQRHKMGTQEFLFPNDTVYVISGDAKPIKVLDRGQGILGKTDPFSSGDLTTTFYYGQEFGVGVVAGSHKMGVATYA